MNIVPGVTDLLAATGPSNDGNPYLKQGLDHSPWWETQAEDREPVTGLILFLPLYWAKGIWTCKGDVVFIVCSGALLRTLLKNSQGHANTSICKLPQVHRFTQYWRAMPWFPEQSSSEAITFAYTYLVSGYWVRSGFLTCWIKHPFFVLPSSMSLVTQSM